MIHQSYLNFCQTLWNDWLSGKLDFSSDLRKHFQTDYAPEPYLRFGEGKKPLYILTTNPGRGISTQHREEIKKPQSSVHSTMSYRQAALAFARFYSGASMSSAKKRISSSASRRILAQEEIKDLRHKDCVVQFESLPFHSSKLPGKARIPDLVKSSPCLTAYVSLLAETLQGISVVALSAIGTNKSISKHSIRDSVWLSWQAKSLLGINAEKVKLEPLAKKNAKISSGFLYQKVDGCVRGIVVTMGGNNFPGREGREKLARVLSG